VIIFGLTFLSPIPVIGTKQRSECYGPNSLLTLYRKVRMSNPTYLAVISSYHSLDFVSIVRSEVFYLSDFVYPTFNRLTLLSRSLSPTRAISASDVLIRASVGLGAVPALRCICCSLAVDCRSNCTSGVVHSMASACSGPNPTLWGFD
jgi:hypothetical protein